jgi:predicted ATPase/class 3 adenylate cyclase/Tfp pilus assembly protein PilF
MADAPSGTVTLLFTDIEGSTKLLQRSGELYAELLADHRSMLRAAFDSHDGYEVDTEGDAFFIAFRSAQDAAAAAAEAQRALAEHSWPDGNEVRVRMGLHTGEPRLVDRAYVGLDVHRAARVMGAGHGGQVLLSQSTRNQFGADWPLLDLGEHLLKDLQQPEHLFQLLIEGLPSEFPALKTLGNRPTNLPAQPNPLIGRENELREISQLLRTDDVRLLTLTGPGGAGKTRLALQIGAELLDDFRSGVFFVSLAPIADEDLLVPTIAQALAIREISGEGLAATLSAYLSDKQMLLVLDNLEQIVGAAPAIARLLGAAPEVRILATSRERLRLSAEQAYEVPPLMLPDAAQEDLGTLLGTDAIALFLARAEAVTTNFVLTQENAASVVAICRRLEGLPLALELAAARIAVLSPAALLSRLSGRLAVLTGGARDSDERHQTLRNTIEWSYDLLEAPDQLLFRRLAVFVDGCRLDAAEAVCNSEHDDGTALDGLQSLVDKSLVRNRPDSDGEPRFWMLETIREYASERFAKSGEAGKIARRHAEHFLELAEQAEPDLWAQQTDIWLPRLDPEEANFRAALGWAIAQDEAEVAVRLAGSLYPFWEIRARQGEARAWLSRALALHGAVPPSCRAKALVAAGRATAWHGDMGAAIALLEEAAELSKQGGDLEGVGRCLGFIGHALLFTGNPERAAAVLDEAVDLARNTRDRHSVARAIYNSAFVAIEQGDFDRACELFEEAAQIGRSEGAKLQEANCLAHLGYTCALAGDYERAAALLDEGVALFTALGETTWTQVAFRYLGLLALLDGRIDEAESLLRTSLLEGREQAPQWEIAHWLEELAAVAAAKGETLRAAKLWGATDALFEKLGLATLEENRQVRERFRNVEESPDSDSRAEAWTQGHDMTLEQAVGYALTREAVGV